MQCVLKLGGGLTLKCVLEVFSNICVTLELSET